MARRVGNWELDPVPIGSGSFAIVWKARHVDTAVQAAVKEINTERLSPKLLESLESEVAVLRRTQHRNIVRMLDLIQEPGKMFLVLEFCGGGDLGQYLRRYRCVNEPTARYFMHQLSEGLRELYALNVLHRDLKPQNLLLSDTSMTPILKIADFGFARSLQPQGMAETLCGSPLYMAPEILQSHKYDAKADLWSVGTILHELLTGRPPFTGTNHIQLLHNIQRLEPRLAEALPGHLSQPCRQLLLRLLRHRPQERMGFDEFFQHPFVQGQQEQQGRAQQGPQGLGRADRQPSAAQVEPAAQDERGQRLGSAQEAAAHDRRHHQQLHPYDPQQQHQQHQQHVHQHQQQPQQPHKRSGQQQLQQQQQGGADSDCEYVVVSGSSSPAPNLTEQQAAAPGVTAFANWTQSVHATATAAAGALAGLGPSASAHTAGRGAHALHVHHQQHQHQQHHRNNTSRRAHAPVAMARRAAPVVASMASAWAAAAAQAVATVARSVQHASPSSASSRQAAAAAAAASRGTFFHYPQLSVSGQATEPAAPTAVVPREQEVTRISSGDKQAPSEQPSTPARHTAAEMATPAGGAARQLQADVPVDVPASDAGSGRNTGDTPARPPGASPSTPPQRQQEQQGGGKDLDTALLWRCARLPERLDGADLLQRVVLLLSESANARASAAEAAELAAEEHEEDEEGNIAGLQEGSGLQGKAGEDIQALQRARRRQYTAQVAAGALPGQLLALHLYSCQLLEAGLASSLGKSVDGLCHCEEREAPSGASAGGMPEAKGGESETVSGAPSSAACTADISEQQAESQPASGRSTAAAFGRTTDPRLLLPLKRQATSLLACLKGRTMRLLRGQVAEQQLLQAKAAAPSKGEQAACLPYALDDEEAGQVAAAAVVPEPAAAVLDAALRYSRAAAADELLGLLPASVEGYARAADLLLFLLADLHAPSGWPGPAAPGAEAGSLLPEHLKPKMSPEERQRVHSIYAAVKLRQASCMAALNAQLSV